MKNYIAILMAALSIISCEKDNASITKETDGKVELSFKATLSPMPMLTKSMGEQPTIAELKLYVFGTAGILKECVSATCTKVSGNQYSFTASLSPQSGETSIHFIASGQSTGTFSQTTESALISSMYDEDGRDSYWQRVILDYGISEGMSLGDITLVRNYAKITLSSEAPNFTLLGYSLVNTPVRGYVAPYYGGKFLENFQNKSFTQIKAEYAGDGRIKSRINTALPSQYDLNAKYMYPRLYFDPQFPTYIMAKGSYNDGTSSYIGYYKVNLSDENGYVPVYRNFHYAFNITNVYHRGSSTPEDAATTPGTGHLMVDLETTQPIEITDGKQRLELEYTSKVFHASGTDDLTIAYYPDASSSNPDNSQIRIIGASGDVLSGITQVSTTTYRLTIKEPQSGMLKQRVEVVAGDLREEMTFYSIKDLQISATCDPSIVDINKGAQTDLCVSLPADLPHVVFPVYFKISVEKNSLSPRDNAISLAQANGEFWFNYRLDYDKYSSLQSPSTGRRLLRLPFETNKEESASRIYVSCDLSDEVSTEFRNKSYSSFSGLSFGDWAAIATAESTPVSFSFSMPSSEPVDICLNGLESMDSRLVEVGSNSTFGTKTYRFSGATAGTNSVSLRTTKSFKYLRAELSAQGYRNANYALRALLEDESVKVTFNSTNFTSGNKYTFTNAGYYLKIKTGSNTSYSSVNMKKNDSFTFSTTQGVKIKKMTFKLTVNERGLKCSTGSMSGETGTTPTWTGSSTSITLSCKDTQTADPIFGLWPKWNSFETGVIYLQNVYVEEN